MHESTLLCLEKIFACAKLYSPDGERFCLRKTIFVRRRKILPAQKLMQKEKRVKKAAESTNNRLIGRLLYILSFNASRGLQRFDADKICVTALAVWRSACYNDLIAAL